MTFVRSSYRFIILSLVLLALLPLGLSAPRPTGVDAQDSSPILIESDDSRVEQTGNWTSQPTQNASGGSYLYSSGSTDDVLSLDFYGSYIEIVYVENPSFGTFAIEIDNDIRRTVVTTSEETTFDNRAVVDYLDDGPHTLRVYAVDGVIAIDAFITHLSPLLSVPTENTEAGVTWWVATNGSNSNNCLSAGTACRTIQAAIDKATNDDTISVAAGTYTNAIDINKNVTIQGANQTTTIIDSTSFSGIVVTVQNGVTAELSNVTITNVTSGWAIRNSGNLTLNDATITNNTVNSSTAQGIAITNQANATIVINRCRITNNTVTSPVSNSSDTMAGGIILNVDNATMTITESVISNNKMVNQGLNALTLGGTMAVGGNVTIIDSVISFNTADSSPNSESQGGAIFAGGENLSLTITRTTFTGNIATGASQHSSTGGAIAVSPDIFGDATVIISDSTFYDNHADSLGGALYLFAGAAYIENTSIFDNTAKHGGGMVNGLDLNIANSTISGNQASENGGAIYTIGLVNLSHTTITNNTADSDNNSVGTGGGIFREMGTTTFKNSIIAGNRSGISTANDCSSGLTSQGYNVVGQNGTANGCPTTGTDFVLAGDINTIIEPLYNNGGQTLTHALNLGTTPVNAIPPASCTYLSSANNPLFNNGDPITTDQRGSARPVNSNCDIGAYEIEADTCTLDDSIVRINVGPYGIQGNGQGVYRIQGLDISNNGRFIAFSSNSSNLVPNDLNQSDDTFRYDRITGELLIIDMPDGELIQNGAINPSISADGQRITFDSNDTNIVAGDTNNATDVFLYDVAANTFERISVSSTEEQGNTLSLFTDISPDGQSVAFYSYASNIVENDTNDLADLFVRDLQSGQTTRENVSSNGDQAEPHFRVWGIEWPSQSDDSRYLAFASSAPNLVENDTNSTEDIFVRDRQLGETYLVSIAPNGDVGNSNSSFPVISADGRYIAFVSNASNLVPDDTNNADDIFVRDLQTGTTTRVSVSTVGEESDTNEHDYFSGIDMSRDGRYVVFPSTATNLVSNDTNGVADIFVHDRITGETIRVTDSLRTQEPNGSSYFLKISGDGQFVAFISGASNLVCGDTNGVDDVFLAQVSMPAFIPAPTNLQATPVATDQIDLSWEDNASDETNYIIDRSNDGVNWTENYVTLPADTTTYSDTGLTCSTTYHYRVRAFRSGDNIYSDYSNVANATTDACIVDYPVQISPLGTQTSPVSTFLWSAVADATWYRVYITNPSVVVLDTWYQVGGPGLTCTSSTCTLNIGDSFVNNTYTWYLQGWGPNGYSNWSTAAQFTINVPIPTTLNKIAPANSATLTDPDVTFTWDHDPNATWYQFHVVGVSTWYKASSICVNDTCSTQRSLNNGNYIWYVQAYGPGGTGPWGTGHNFTVAVPTPAILTKVAPIGLISTSTPDFVWQHDPNATWYQLWIGNIDSTIHTAWYQASTICSAGTCTIPAPNTYIGQYQWYVRGWGVGGYGDWGSPTNFSYIMSLNAPTGTVNGTNIAYEWDDVGPTTTWYQIWVGTSSGAMVINQWIDGSTICNGATCSFTKTITLLAGNYQWYLQPYGPSYGVGPWSSAQTFNISP